MARSEIVLDSVLDAVGNTPLIRLDRIAKHEGLQCNLLGKLECTSAGGSVKDRIAKRMIEVAEQEGKLIPGQSVVIEPTSGNTGIGLAMACAVKGYSVIITMPKKMSLEKEAALRALGAEVIRTPNEAAWDAPESHIGVALRLQKEIPGGIILDQYRNVCYTRIYTLGRYSRCTYKVNNPLAHELTTAPEIIAAVTSTPSTPAHPSSGKVDVFVGGAGTGGTVSGIAKGIKKAHNKECIVVGVDPVGSVLALPTSLNEVGKGDSYIVEGIGYDFTPDVLTREPGMINAWVKTDDKVSFAAVQLLMRHEGMLVGGSSGSALAGTLAWLRSESGCEIAQSPGKNVVVLLPDGLRNYIGKDWFLDMALRQEPSPLARRIAEVLDRPGTEDRTNAKMKL
ncbi:pyridoxal phosphate-dependent enzyme beta subunit [Lactarius hatsudake]|nr:pyridoxal phosphate-dependent enzyme beta subunit [Lactarius hatsudake]